MECLNHRLKDFESLVQILGQADAEVVRRAVQSASRLPEISVCANAAALKAHLEPPASSQELEQVRRLRDLLSRARILNEAGKHQPGLTLAGPALAEAETLGYRPLLAEAHLVMGELRANEGRPTDARKQLEQAYFQARSSGHDEIAGQAAVALTGLLGDKLRELPAALTWAEHARAEVQRLGRPPVLEGSLQLVLGLIQDAKGDYPAALASHRLGLEILQKHHGKDHLQVADAHEKVGSVLEALGQRTEALQHMRRALEIMERTLGPDHPDLVHVLGSIGLSLSALGQATEAVAAQERSVRIARAGYGPEHLDTGFALLNLGVAQYYVRHLAEAEAAYREAARIVEKTLGPDHPDTALCLTNLGIVLDDQGDYPHAEEMHRRTLAIYEKALGKEHPRVAVVETNLAAVLIHAKRYQDARPHLERSLKIYAKTMPDAPEVAFPLTSLGAVELHLGLPAAAIAPLERALTLRDANHVDPQYGAETRFALAQALWQSGRDRRRALTLAREAQQTYEKLGSRWQKELAGVKAWLAARAPGAR
jgi:eukaryotic-like serine/threonine-protein kinase